MNTYQDLLKVGESGKADFCRRAVDDFKGTIEYKIAKDGEAYYHKHNLTIESYQKYLYTLSGAKVDDIFSANYKLKTTFFHRLVTQQVQYVLGNGLTLQKMENKEKLGKDFDKQLKTIAKMSCAGGRAFGFWNLDHLEVFGFADTISHPGFCPLYDEDTSKLMAGIRFWYKKVGNSIISRFTLYEADGYTEYVAKDDNKVKELTPKRAYKLNIKATKIGGIENVESENYSALPIVEMFANDSHESELVGLRENIDCYDFIKSGLANEIDDTSGFYWVLKNTDGMDDPDLAKFIQRMKTVRASVMDGEDASAEAHTMDVPTEARRVMLEILRDDIYDDFQALNVKTLSAAAKTTQEIQAAYQSQDDKCADFEYEVIDFVQKILELAGIDDNPTFTWNKVVNQTEQVQNLMMCANYLPDDVIVKHLPFLTPEEADEICKVRDQEGFKAFNNEEDEE